MRLNFPVNMLVLLLVDINHEINDEESGSSHVPSNDILSSSHQVGDWALKSPRIR